MQLGLKTGSTSLALYNLSASATRDNLSLIAVIMKAPTSKDRFEDAKKILDYGFKNYEFKMFGNKGDVVGNVNIDKGVENSVNAVLSDDCGILVKKNSIENITQNVHLEKNLPAPISKGSKIGEVKFCIDDRVIKSVDIISDKEVKKESLCNVAVYVYKKWFSLLR